MRHFTDQEIMDRLDQAPPLVQERIGDPRTTLEVADMGRRRKLHVDQIGKIVEMNRNLLLGIVNPQDFLQELIAAGITELDARQIMTEINQKIFMPLREKMKSAATGAPAKASAPQPPLPPRIADTPAPATPSATQPQRYFHLGNKLPPNPQSARPPVPAVPSVSSAPQIIRPPAVQIQTSKPVQMPPAPSQPKPMNILSSGPEPEQLQSAPARPAVPGAVAPLPPKTVLPRPGQPAAPVSMPAIQALRPVVTPPPNLPGAMTPSELLPSRKPAPQAPAVTPKPYSADPYREPIEP